MSAVSVTQTTEGVLITRRQSGVYLALAIPYIAYWIGCVAIVFVAAYRTILSLTTHANFAGTALFCALLFGAKSWWLGRALYRMIAAQDRFHVRGATLQVERGSLLSLTDYGTFTASTLTDLELKSGNNLVWPQGCVQASIGSVPLVIAEFISDTDGSRLIDALTEAYPFNTPPAAPSPAVIRW